MGKKTLFIAAGHGGHDAGNTASGHVEATELLAIVGGMRGWYRAYGIPAALGGCIFLDDKLDLAGQIGVLRSWKPRAADGDLAVDVHLDYRSGDADGGALVLYDETPYARAFAEAFLGRWCQGTGIRSNGVHRSSVVAQRWRGWPDFGFTAAAWPGCILELGCLNYPRDMAVVRDPVYRALCGQFIYEAWHEATGR